MLNVPVQMARPLTFPRKDVAVAVALRPCAAAVIVAVPPVPSPVICPLLGSISTTLLSLLVHTTPLLICDLLLSLSVPQACKVIDWPTWICGLGGWIVIEVRVASWKNPWHPTPNAAASKTPNASANSSFFPANLRPVAITNRLGLHDFSRTRGPCLVFSSAWLESSHAADTSHLAFSKENAAGNGTCTDLAKIDGKNAAGHVSDGSGRIVCRRRRGTPRLYTGSQARGASVAGQAG